MRSPGEIVDLALPEIDASSVAGFIRKRCSRAGAGVQGSRRGLPTDKSFCTPSEDSRDPENFFSDSFICNLVIGPNGSRLMRDSYPMASERKRAGAEQIEAIFQRECQISGGEEKEVLGRHQRGRAC